MSAMPVPDPDAIPPVPPDPDPGREDDREALSWAIDVQADPSLAAADWLARDIDADCSGAVGLLTDPEVSIEHLRAAKSAYKTMRIMGETAADRRIGGSLYAATIAAALVWHGERISRQSDGALDRAFRTLRDNEEVPAPIRDLGHRAIERMRELGGSR